MEYEYALESRNDCHWERVSCIYDNYLRVKTEYDYYNQKFPVRIVRRTQGEWEVIEGENNDGND